MKSLGTMKKNQPIIPAVLFGCLMVVIALILLSCGNSSEHKKSSDQFDAPEPYYLGSTDAVPGKTYSIHRDDCQSCQDVIYLAGNLPVIISVPHGGSLVPPDIPPRICGTSADDRYTIELAAELKNSVASLTNDRYPHIIVNYLDRSLIDQNRDVSEECNPNPADPNDPDYQGYLRGKNAWDDFHINFIGAIAIKKVLQDYGKGLYIDLHGHSSFGYPDVILGYNLTALNLANSDETLNDESRGYTEKSSIRFLYNSIKDTTTFSNIVRGDESFGEIMRLKLESRYPNTYTVAPSVALQKPMLMFSGEYNIKIYGGVKDGDIDNNYNYDQNKFISGFQLEVCADIRTDSANDYQKRKDFADIVARSILEFLDRHSKQTPDD